jgi:chromosome segregation ATPase
MEPRAMARTEQDAPRYLSPKRVLARAFEISRDLWKKKYESLREELKALRTVVRDLRRSREHWRAKAEALEQKAKKLQTQLKQRAEPLPPALS